MARLTKAQDEHKLLHGATAENVLAALLDFLPGRIATEGGRVFVLWPDDGYAPKMATAFEVKVLHAKRVRIPTKSVAI